MCLVCLVCLVCYVCHIIIYVPRKVASSRRMIMPVSRVLLVALLGLGYWGTFTVEGIEIFMYVLLHQPWVSYDADCLGVHLSLSLSLSRSDLPSEWNGHSKRQHL